MINSITRNSAPAAPARINRNQSSGRPRYQTPFGEVMIDQLGHKFLNTPGAAAPASPIGAHAAATLPKVTPPASTVGTPATSSAATLVETSVKPAATPSATTPASNASTPDPHSIPTTQSIFGDDVWVKQPEFANPNGTRGSYNPIYFATKATAEKIAAMVGGKVVEQNALADNVFHQSVPNQMIELPNGARVNAGLIADFYNHGYPQSYVDMLVQAEIRGATA